MCSLLESYKGIEDFYYDNIDNLFCNENLVMKKRDFISFIKTYFGAGDKGSVNDGLSLPLKKGNEARGKHGHSVSLYFLGHLMKDLVKKRIKELYGQNDEEAEDKFFLYVWFLTSLWHDIASPIEQSEYQDKPMGFFLGKNDVYHGVYQHQFVPPTPNEKFGWQLTYPENLVFNYFDYRVKHWLSIDHGILGGYLLYDRLRKNYDLAWEECSTSETKECCPIKCGTPCGYTCFYHKQRLFRVKHWNLYAIVADSLIGHNIWVASKKNKDVRRLYDIYGLSPLVAPTKIKIEDRPLLFFLALLDTIEPIKRLAENDKDVLHVLANVGISVTGRVITIWVGEDIEGTKCMEWFKDIKKSLGNWLNVTVKGEYENSKSKQEIKITIEG